VVEGEVLLDHQVVDLDVSESRHEGFDRRPGILRRRGGRAALIAISTSSRTRARATVVVIML